MPVTKFTFNFGPKPPKPPEENWAQKGLRVLTDPLTTTVGLKGTMDRLASPGLNDSKAMAMLKGALVGGVEGLSKPTTLAQIAALPAMAAGEAGVVGGGLLSRLMSTAIPKTGVIPGVAKLAALSTKVPSLVNTGATVGNTALATEGGINAYKDINDPEASKSKVALDLLNTIMGAVGARAGWKGLRTGSKVSRPSVTNKSVIEDQVTALHKDMLENGFQVAEDGYSHPDLDKAIATKYPEAAEEFRKKPAGILAQKIFGDEGKPPQAPAIVAQDRLAKARVAKSKAEEAAAKLNTNAAADDIQINEEGLKAQEAAKAANVASINQGFKDNADANKGLAQAQAIQQKVVGTAQDQAIVEDAKREAENIAQAEADRQATKLEELRGTLTETKQPSTIKTSITGEGAEGLGKGKATLVEQAPEPENGGDGETQAGGSKTVPVDPLNKHYSSRAEGNEVINAQPDPSKYDLGKTKGGNFRIFEMAPEPPSDPIGGVPVEPSGPGGPPSNDRLAIHGMRLSEGSANKLSKSLAGSYVKQVSPTRFEVRFSELDPQTPSVAPVEPPQPTPIQKWEAGGPPPSQPKQSLVTGDPADSFNPANPGVEPPVGEADEFNPANLESPKPVPQQPVARTPQELRYIAAMDERSRLAKESAAAKSSAPIAPFINPKGEAEPTLPGLEPTVNSSQAPVAEVPFGLTPPPTPAGKPLVQSTIIPKPIVPISTKGAKLTEANKGADELESLFNATTGEGEIPADLNPDGGGTQPKLDADAVQAEIDKHFAGQPQAIEPSTPPNIPSAQGGVAPIRQFEDAGKRYEALQAAKKAGDRAPETEAARRAALDETIRLQDAVVKANPSPSELEGLSGIHKQRVVEDLNKRDLENLSNLSPTERASVLRDLFKKAKGGQTGFSQVGLPLRMISAGLGSTVGYKEDPLGNPLASGIAGGTAGFFMPEVAKGFWKTAPQIEDTLIGARDKIANAAKYANQIHNMGLLSPLSVIKKGAGDIGGMALASAENPGIGGKILSQFLSREGRSGIANSFREGYNGPEQESLGGLELAGILNSNKNPFSWSGKTMGGLTKATKDILGEAGLTTPEQRYYTLTDYPRYDASAKFYNAIRTNPFSKFMIPFARVGINRLERGYEYSPFGMANLLMKKHSSGKAGDQLIKTLMGSAATGAAYDLTPENFVKEHPILASTEAALAGPLGLPVLAGMALKNAHRQKDDPLHLLPDESKLADATGEIARDVPGLRLIEDAAGRDPKGFVRNSLSGLTNSVRPLALAQDYMSGETTEPDLSSKDLSTVDQLTNRMKSNVPFLRQTLPKKKISLTGTPKFTFKF